MNLFASKRSARTTPGSSAFQLSPVAAGCAIFMALAGHAAYAQEEQTTSQATAQAGGDAAPTNGNVGVQTVKVTGIRRGIEAAISVKKNNDSIVEAISAEDIGKLPDQSIAESIARLPGVTAQNVRGQASVISIRGMSPDFSTGLLNGREQVSTGDSRSVEFDNYPSELLSGVVVYKTPDGALVGQGLSGTVDMQTVRPLDFKERTMAVNYRRQKTGLGMDNKGSGNRFTFSYIDQFADRKIGVAFGFARLQDKSGDSTRLGSWGMNDPVSNPWSYNGQSVRIQNDGIENWTDTYKENRNGLMGVIQFKPNRDFSSTIDLLYTRYNRDTSSRGLQLNMFDAAPTVDAKTGVYSTPTGLPYDQRGVLTNATVTNGVVTAGTISNVRGTVRNDAVAWSDVTKSIGWNNKLRVNQDWTAAVDLSFNSAQRDGTNIETYGGSSQYDTVNFNGTSVTPTLNYADTNNIRLRDVSAWGGTQVQAGYVKFPHVYDQIDAIRFDAIRDLPDGWLFSKVDFGANFSNRSKTRSYTEDLMSIAGQSNPLASAAYPNSGVAQAGASGINIVTFDPVQNIGVYNLDPKLHPEITNKDWTVREKVETVFAKLNIDTQLGWMPVRGALGVQGIHTNQSSTAFSVDTASGSSDATRPTAPVDRGTSYNDFLPSLNLIGDLGNQQTLRFSVEKIMARPTLEQMRASGSFGYDQTRGIYTGSGGNPNLKPFRAKGIDLSYEKYWDSKAYVSAAVFYRKLDTYVVTAEQQFDFTQYIQPSTFQAPSVIGSYSAPINGSGGQMKGIELAASLPLNVLTRYLDGFGVVANASQTGSSVSIPDITNGGAGNMMLPGLSKRVASLTLYYEKAGFSARVADRFRSDFIGSVEQNTGEQQLTYIQGGQTIDLQLGYEVQTGPLKGVSFLVEMNNVNNQEYKEYRKTKDNVITDTKYGRTLLYGLNYKF
ncbi:TonB-dependent receptor [Massilia sp. 9096]|uniref:TonB-dependent receptor n=1 Tax=Massilia sp. 9096 TaxID=1500894 RepID=UPI000561A55C|nr:TonB-dependent receptor [Massilia sp. 9096]